MSEKASRATRSVEALTATVRVLMVGPRAMTVSMYSQLETAYLFDESGAQLGTPWGRVNHSAGCDRADKWEWDLKGAAHAHVVWERDDELRKCCVRREVPDSLVAPWKRRRRVYEELMWITRAADEKPEYDLNERNQLCAVRWPDYTARADYGFESRLAFSLGQPDSMVAKAEMQLRLREIDDRPSEAWTDYEAQANDVERAIDALRSKWRKRHEECMRLPLLIIGVTAKEVASPASPARPEPSDGGGPS